MLTHVQVSVPSVNPVFLPSLWTPAQDTGPMTGSMYDDLYCVVRFLALPCCVPTPPALMPLADPALADETGRNGKHGDVLAGEDDPTHYCSFVSALIIDGSVGASIVFPT